MVAAHSSSVELLFHPEQSIVLSPEEYNQADITDEIDPGYQTHVSDRFISLVGSDKKVPVKILRASGSLDFVLASVLSFTSDTATGDFVLVRDTGLTMFPAPLHKVVLFSDQVEGEVTGHWWQFWEMA